MTGTGRVSRPPCVASTWRWSECLDVRLVLIPDKEDPDSYVRKLGAAAFRDFIAANKKDFILFQLEVALKDAGTDSNKKAAVVNQVAETIARVNKAEDFTRQQDYIRQSAEILRIDEAGLHTLVNKYIRERIAKQENKAAAQEAQNTALPETAVPQDDESINLFFRHEQNERGMIRDLLEFGLRPWNDESLVADYILTEAQDLIDLIDNKRLLAILDIYKNWYKQGLEPTSKNFLYHEDQELSALAVSIMDLNAQNELSPNWKEHYEGKIALPDELYKETVLSTVRYLKLRKIHRLIEENQNDMKTPHSEEDLKVQMETARSPGRT